MTCDNNKCEHAPCAPDDREMSAYHYSINRYAQLCKAARIDRYVSVDDRRSMKAEEQRAQELFARLRAKGLV